VSKWIKTVWYNDRTVGFCIPCSMELHLCGVGHQTQYMEYRVPVQTCGPLKNDTFCMQYAKFKNEEDINFYIKGMVGEHMGDEIFHKIFPNYQEEAHNE
jgi:hypothetical protein